MAEPIWTERTLCFGYFNANMDNRSGLEWLKKISVIDPFSYRFG
jgi:hypothetical protein